MAYVSHSVGESRIFDCLYDPSFILSGRNDFLRANSNAMAMSTPIQILTRYDMMFSNIPKMYRQINWRGPNVLPDFRLRGGEEHNNYKINIRGRDRTNYYYHPVNVNIINLCFRTCNDSEPPEHTEIIKIKKNTGCQTNYRESSAQTCPYQPDAILRMEDPENSDILLAAKLIHGLDQPGELEAQIIERARKRRNWERNIIKLTSKENVKQYRNVLEAFEWEEWLSREEEIEAVQNMRMKIVLHLFQKRDNDFKKSEQLKLNRLKQNIMDKRKDQKSQLKLTYNREIRKLNYKHKNVIRKYRKNNISLEYSDPGSDFYGPQMRFGVDPKRKHFVGYKEKFESRLDDLDRKIRKQPTGLQCPFAKDKFLAQPKQLPKEYQLGFCSDKSLQKLYKTLKFLRLKSLAKKGIPKCLTQKLQLENTGREIKYTVVGVENDALNESEYQCCTYLQKIIKGRAIQNILFSGKEEFIGLIDEFNTTYTLTAVKNIFPDKDKDKNEKQYKALSRQRRIERLFKNDKEVQKVLEDFEGTTIGWLLEFYEKELDRLYEQKKIHAVCMLAEEERFKRESIEAGKRQKENRRRVEHQEIYNSISKTTRDTISLYLEDVLIEESDLKAISEARNKIKTVAKKIDRIADITSKTTARLSVRSIRVDETNIISDIVNDFIFPEVQKSLARKNMDNRQKRHLLAAHDTLYAALNDAYPKPPEIKKNSDIMIPYSILDNIIDVVPDSSSSDESEKGKFEHPVHKIVRNLLKKVIPKEKWKTESEIIVRGTISDIIKDVIPTDNKVDRLNLILSEIETRLWQPSTADCCNKK